MNVFVMGASRPQFDSVAAGNALKTVADAIREMGYAVTPDPIMLNEWDIDKQLTAPVREAQRAADLVVVVVATFVGADMVVKILEGVQDKALLWAVPEPSVGLGRLQLNSLCGAIITNNALKVMSREISVIYGDPSAKPTREEFLAHLRVMRVINILRHTVLGILGQRPSGYYPSDFDELQLMATFGVRIKRLSLEEAFRYGQGVSDAEVEIGLGQVQETLVQVDRISHDQVIQSVRAERGLRHLVRDNGLTAMCVECWPQYMTQYGGAVCWANSRLIDDNVIAGCEADVHGTLTMLMQRELSGESPFFGDLVHVADDDRLVFWHCGAAPLSLAGESPRASVHPNRRVGLTLDFALKPGPVTVVRLHRNHLGQYSLMAIPGEAQRDPLYFAGNSVAVKPTSPAPTVLAKLMEDGAEHHFSVGYNVPLSDVMKLGQRLNIPVKVY